MLPKPSKEPKSKPAKPSSKKPVSKPKKPASGSGKKSTTGKKVSLKPSAARAASGLTLLEAQTIVVDNTPRPDKFKGDPDMLLKELGILGDNEVAGHKAGIVSDLTKKKKLTIDPNDIISGPGVDVATCRDSVFNNAN